MSDCQTKELFSKVDTIMKEEKDAEKITDVLWQTAQVTGVSEKTITKILSEKRTNPSTSFTSPLKRRKMKPVKIDIEEFDVGIIRRATQDFQKDNETPTLFSLRQILKEKIQFEWCQDTLRKLLLKIGYRWHKTETNTKVLLEKHEMEMSRLTYLKKVKELRDSGKPIVYTDESYIYTNNEQNKSLLKKDPRAEAKQLISTRGPRLIIVHAGSSAGFIPNALLMYKTDDKTGDYCGQMDSNKYLKWLQTHLIPNLPKDAVVVMDDAPYHNATTEKIPNMLESTKAEMQAWLTAKNIAYEEDFIKAELEDLIEKNKKKFIKYKVDEILKEHNFTVLRLPAYHLDINPLSNIWDLVRNHVVTRSGQNSTNILCALNEAFEKANSNWANACRDVEKIEEEYMKNFEFDLNGFIYDLPDSESDEDDDDDIDMSCDSSEFSDELSDNSESDTISN